MTIRRAVVADARRMVRLLRVLLDETPFMLRLPEEQRSDSDGEARYIARMNEAGNCLILVAEESRTPVGTLVVTGGSLHRLAHVGYLGMGVLRSHCAAGIGRALLEESIEWAAANPFVQKLSLQVFENNPTAIALYKQLGFREEGRLEREVRLEEGYVDMLQLALFV